MSAAGRDEQTMTTICIRCLNLEDREVPPSDDLPTGDAEAGKSRKEFTEYCCEWWTTHYSLSQDTSGEDTFQDMLFSVSKFIRICHPQLRTRCSEQLITC